MPRYMFVILATWEPEYLNHTVVLQMLEICLLYNLRGCLDLIGSV